MRLGLSGWLVIALGAGIFCGLFFGEAAGRLELFGEAYIGLLQMTVLPYIVLSLVGGIGSLRREQARKLGGTAFVVLVTRLGQRGPIKQVDGVSAAGPLSSSRCP